jgi:predicted nucleotidyltransferase
MAYAGDRISRIILFGSRAAGTTRADSDFDILVVERGSFEKRHERARLREALKGSRLSVDLWVMGEEEFEETKDVVGGLAYPASRSGIVLQ